MPGLCQCCGDCPAIDEYGCCGHCHWEIQVEIERGLDELCAYLAQQDERREAA